jgi:NTP pyrophosphatase (non-canonical NTP hydrolase)
MTKFEELMIITMEECGELIQACSKMCRNRNEKHTQELIKEIGDVCCMIELLQEYDLVTQKNILEGMRNKRNKLKKWSNLISHD